MKAMNKKIFTRIMAFGLAALMVLGCVAMLAGCSKTDPYANLSDDEYMQKVEKENLKETISGLTEFYGALGKVKPGAATESHSKVEMGVQVGDMIIDMLEQSYKSNTGSEMDFDFLANIGVAGEMSMKGDLMQENLTILLNNKKVVSATVLMNMAEAVLYFAVPELNEDFVKVDMNAMGGMGGSAMPDFSGSAMAPSFGVGGAVMAPTAIMEMLPKIMEKLPSEEVFAKLLNRYIDVILANLKNTTRSAKSLEAGDLKQVCTVVSTKIYEADAKELVKAVLNTALTDQELKQVVDGISEIAETDLYPAFKQGIEQALASINTDDELDTENYIELITYVDSNHNVIGREIFGLDRENAVASYYTVTSGDKFAFKAEIQGITVTGNGTEKKGATTGTYTLNVGGTDYVTLAVDNFKATDKDLTGTVRIEPSAKLLSMMFGSTSGVPFADLALEIQLATDGIAAKLLGNDALIVGVSVKMKESAGGKIEVPSDYVNANNPAAMQQWLNGMDMNALLNNLKTAGVPAELIEMLMGMG